MTELAAVWDNVPRRPSAPPAARADNDALDLTPLGETIGAVVHGVDLARAPGPGTLAFLREAVAAYKVVFVEAAARPPRPALAGFAAQLPELRPARVVRGQAQWFDTAEAFAALPHDVRRRLWGRYVAHDLFEGAHLEEALAPRPAVRQHPQTGRHALNVDFLRRPRLIGFAPEEGAGVLQSIHEVARDPERSVIAPGQPAELALWDPLAAALLPR
jgi:alpha-ketoglutarate-dependent taurine dioxygenase